MIIVTRTRAWASSFILLFCFLRGCHLFPSAAVCSPSVRDRSDMRRPTVCSMLDGVIDASRVHLNIVVMNARRRRRVVSFSRDTIHLDPVRSPLSCRLIRQSSTFCCTHHYWLASVELPFTLNEPLESPAPLTANTINHFHRTVKNTWMPISAILRRSSIGKNTALCILRVNMCVWVFVVFSRLADTPAAIARMFAHANIYAMARAMERAACLPDACATLFSICFYIAQRTTTWNVIR